MNNRNEANAFWVELCQHVAMFSPHVTRLCSVFRDNDNDLCSRTLGLSVFMSERIKLS
jgi:hypothetical protein